MQQSGGLLLAAGLDGGNTLIFFPFGAENANRARSASGSGPQRWGKAKTRRFCGPRNRSAAPRSHPNFDRVRVGFFFLIFDELPVFPEF